MTIWDRVSSPPFMSTSNILFGVYSLSESVLISIPPAPSVYLRLGDFSLFLLLPLVAFVIEASIFLSSLFRAPLADGIERVRLASSFLETSSYLPLSSCFLFRPLSSSGTLLWWISTRPLLPLLEKPLVPIPSFML